jgi:hypothetical protein
VDVKDISVAITFETYAAALRLESNTASTLTGISVSVQIESLKRITMDFDPRMTRFSRGLGW